MAGVLLLFRALRGSSALRLNRILSQFPPATHASDAMLIWPLPDFCSRPPLKGNEQLAHYRGIGPLYRLTLYLRFFW